VEVTRGFGGGNLPPHVRAGEKDGLRMCRQLKRY
jgi:hypothetical protein